VDSTQPIHWLVAEVLPEMLLAQLANQSDIKVRGSAGLGNITAAPWVATFDTRITSSAASGYYVVYLFSIDMQSLYLCFGLGATQFNEAFSKKVDVYGAMEAARERMFEVVVRHLPANLNHRMEIGDTDLGASASNKLHRDYERGNVFSLKYDIANLPSEGDFVDDYRSIVSFMQRVVSDPLTPDMLSLLKSTSDLDSRDVRTDIGSFSPRKPKVRGSTGSFGSGYSKTAKIVGDAGELIVLSYERDALIAQGRDDLAELIVHEEAVGNRPGWDITSYDKEGKKKLIEVKSSQGKTMNALEITRNEWDAATTHGRDYHIYLVTNALSQKPSIEVLRDPFAYVESSQLSLTPQRFLLDLRTQK
jgi:hypothetical protein